MPVFIHILLKVCSEIFNDADLLLQLK